MIAYEACSSADTINGEKGCTKTKNTINAFGIGRKVKPAEVLWTSTDFVRQVNFWIYLQRYFKLWHKVCKMACFFFLKLNNCIKVQACMYVCAKLLQLCLTLCNPMDCRVPGSTLHGILQVRILEWVAISFSKDLSNSGIKSMSLMSPAFRLLLTPSAIWEALKCKHANILKGKITQICAWLLQYFKNGHTNI